jgi:uncharacterized protein (TIGR03437 family)
VFVSDRQINFVAPSTTLTATFAAVTVAWGNESVSQTVPLAAADPGIFAIDGSLTAAALIAGTGQTTLARPAAAGDILEIYGTGLGTNPSQVSVTIGGRAAEVLFAGPNPVFPGLDQINARVPAGLTSGAQPLAVRVGSSSASNETFVRLR